MARETVTLIKANPWRYGRHGGHRRHRRNPQTVRALGLGLELPSMNEWVGGILGAGLQTVAPTALGTFTSRLLGTMSPKTKAFINVAASVVALGAVAHFAKKQFGAYKNPFLVGAGSIAAFQTLSVLTDGKIGIPPTMQFFQLPGVPNAVGRSLLPARVGAIEPPRIPVLGSAVGKVEPEPDAMRMPEL